MKRTNQGGSIGGFIIVGVVLAVLFIGGVYALKTYVASQQQGDTVAVDENGVTEGETAPSESASESQTDPSSTSDAAKEEATSRDTSDTETEATPSAGGADGVQRGEATSSDGSATTSGRYADELPQTGPAETAGAAVGVFFLTGAALMYQQSRRIGAHL